MTKISELGPFVKLLYQTVKDTHYGRNPDTTTFGFSMSLSLEYGTIPTTVPSTHSLESSLDAVLLLCADNEELAGIQTALKNDTPRKLLFLSSLGNHAHTTIQFWTREMSVAERLTWMSTYRPAGFEHLSEEFVRNIQDVIRVQFPSKVLKHLEDVFEAVKVPSKNLHCRVNTMSVEVTHDLADILAMASIITTTLAHTANLGLGILTVAGGVAYVGEEHKHDPKISRAVPEFSTSILVISPSLTDITKATHDDLDITIFKSGGV